MQTQQHDHLSTMPTANLKSGRVQTMYERNDPEEQNNNTPEETSEINEMEVLLPESANPMPIKRGDVVEGVIVRIDQDEILVDIGLKSEGVLSTKELPANGYGSFNELHIDDKILVYVMQPETPDGHALLSLKRAHAERQWRIADQQYRDNELLQARVIDYNKGGLIVDVAGIRGFVPISQILNIKRAEVDPWTTVEQRYTPGQLVTGTITKIAPFGAFARIEDGIEGLIHLSELTPGMDPKAALHEGMQLQLRILRIDAERRRLGLSLRQADEVDAKEVPSEPSADSGGKGVAGGMMSLEETPAHQEAVTNQAENSTPRRGEGRGERRERPRRPRENPLLSNLPPGGQGETTAMAEAFRRAARQRTKEDTEAPEE